MATATPAHIVPEPHPAFFVLRIAQLVLAVTLLALFAFLANVYDAFNGAGTNIFTGAMGVGIFTVCVTILFGIYYIVSTRSIHKIYNKWAVLGVEAFLALFWLITFALCADAVADLIALTNYTPAPTYTYCDAYGNCVKRMRLARRDEAEAWPGVFYASLALSVIEWLLFVATLVLLTLALFKHRRATAPAQQPVAYDSKTTEAGPAPVYEQQHQPVPQQTYEQPAVAQPVHQEQPMH